MATLTDPDQHPGADTDIDLTSLITTEWQWARSTNRSSWTDIEEATNAAYTPGKEDVGSYLRATASYKDGHSPTDLAPEDSDKTANLVSANKVLKNLENDAPVFNYAEGDEIPDDDANADKDVGDEIPGGTALQRKVEENSETGDPVGAPVAAYDDDEDVLTYTLSGDDDGGLFTIDRTTGQIRVGKDTTFNASTDTPITGGNNAHLHR